MTSLRITKSSNKIIKLLFVPVTNLISMILIVFHVQRVLCFLSLKKVVELVKQTRSSTKIPTIVKKNHITQISMILTGPVKKLTQKFRNNLNNCQKIHFMKSALYKSLSQLENNVFNALMTNISIQIKRSAINATMAKLLTKIFIIVHTLK